jgi:hypothetical protein
MRIAVSCEWIAQRACGLLLATANGSAVSHYLAVCTLCSNFLKGYNYIIMGIELFSSARWSRTHRMSEQDLQAVIDESSCGGDRGGGGGIGGGSEEEEYIDGRRGKSLSRSWRSLNQSRCRSPRRWRSGFGCPT